MRFELKLKLAIEIGWRMLHYNFEKKEKYLTILTWV